MLIALQIQKLSQERSPDYSNTEDYPCISNTHTLRRIYRKYLRKVFEKEYGPYEMEEQSGFKADIMRVQNLWSC